MPSECILEMKNINKSFVGDVKALDNVSFKVRQGEIHALVGENGAGKSTLMNVLSGVYAYGNYEGQILFEGEECRFDSIRSSERKGISIIHQEMTLIPYLSIEENIFLGNEIGKRGVINWRETQRRTRELLDKVGLEDNGKTLVTHIGIGKQQLVEIAKALSKEVKLLILDEPTAALNENESKKLLDLIKALQRQGITSIIISHKLNEIVQIADSITVLRDGKTVTTMDVKDEKIEEDMIIRHMVGRELTERFPQRKSHIGEMLLEVRDWNVYHAQHSGRQILHDVNINVREGEVVGIAGLMGAGRTEFAMSVFGRSYGKNISGKVFKKGNTIRVDTVHNAISNGLAYASEDRKALGLVLIEDISQNITITNLGRVSKRGVINRYQEVNAANKQIQRLRIKCSSAFQRVGHLSGGNQQKVALAKCVFSKPDVLILDEPTRGIDVGAKYEVYQIINELAEAGKGVIMISSELPELLGICDRIFIMNQGVISGEVSAKEATQEDIMKRLI